MRTLFLQSAVAVLSFVFGGIALRVSRRVTLPGTRSTWELTGWAFLLPAVLGLLMSFAACRAFAAGPRSAVYQLYIRHVPATSYARICAKIAFGVVLCASVSLSRMDARRRTAAGVAITVAAMLAGACIGHAQGALVPRTSYVNQSVFEAAELVALLAAVLAGLRRSTLDRLLWVALALYTAKQALNPLLLGSFAWMGQAGNDLASLTIRAMAAAVYTVMVALAGRRLVLARRGVSVAAMLPATQRQPRMFP